MASLVTHHAHAPAENLQFSQGTIHHHAHRTMRKRLQTWRLGTWNVRSIIDTIGCIEIASGRQDGQKGEDRKVDLIVDELRRYKIKVAGLQETKWFGSEAYNIAGSIVLTSGQNKPAHD